MLDWRGLSFLFPLDGGGFVGFEYRVRCGQKQLRCGYTTGTCAALAAGGAAHLLLTGERLAKLSLVTPAGIPIELPPEALSMEGSAARCAVVKDSGDDPDVTDGLSIVATVSRTQEGIHIDGGEGVGRVTKPGLDQPVGAAAINRVPREMIRRQVQRVCAEVGYAGGLRVVISIPGGAEVAKRSFNAALGIVGGLSILGTSGIVEPMSQGAIVDTIALKQRQAAALGATRLILTPGNYGMDYLEQNGLLFSDVPVVKCSNFIGDALDIAAGLGFQQLLLVGHIGKLVKLAGGIMNTHSRWGDCRGELFCAHAAVQGADRATCQALMGAPTTDACIAILEASGLRAPVLASLTEAIQRQLTRRAAGAFTVGALLFSNQYGRLGTTQEAKELLAQWNEIT